MADSRPPTDRIDPGLLDRYLAGECSPDETAHVQAWIAARPSHAALVAALRPRHADVGWSRLAQRMGAATGVTAARATGSHIADHRPSGPLPRRWRQGVGRSAPIRHRLFGLAGAAVLVLLVGIGLGSLRSKQRLVRQQEYATAPGQREAIVLTDGTQLTLAPASRIEIPADYAAGHRAIGLEGEAFFTVVHDAAHPFSVESRHAVATDVGTAFDVRAYAEDTVVTVAVTEGRVILRGTGAAQRARAASVGAGDLALIGRDGGTTVRHGVDLAGYQHWTTGTLVFDQTPLAQVAAELSRWYGVEIRLGDPVLRRQALSATVTETSPRDAIGALADAAHLRVAIRGRDFTLYQGSPGGR